MTDTLRDTVFQSVPANPVVECNPLQDLMAGRGVGPFDLVPYDRHVCERRAGLGARDEGNLRQGAGMPNVHSQSLPESVSDRLVGKMDAVRRGYCLADVDTNLAQLRDGCRELSQRGDDGGISRLSSQLSALGPMSGPGGPDALDKVGVARAEVVGRMAYANCAGLIPSNIDPSEPPISGQVTQPLVQSALSAPRVLPARTLVFHTAILMMRRKLTGSRCRSD